MGSTSHSRILAGARAARARSSPAGPSSHGSTALKETACISGHHALALRRDEGPAWRARDDRLSVIRPPAPLHDVARRLPVPLRRYMTDVLLGNWTGRKSGSSCTSAQSAYARYYSREEVTDLFSRVVTPRFVSIIVIGKLGSPGGEFRAAATTTRYGLRFRTISRMIRQRRHCHLSVRRIDDQQHVEWLPPLLISVVAPGLYNEAPRCENSSDD